MYKVYIQYIYDVIRLHSWRVWREAAGWLVIVQRKRERERSPDTTMNAAALKVFTSEIM